MMKKQKKRKSSKFVDAGRDNWNKRRELTTWNGWTGKKGDGK